MTLALRPLLAALALTLVGACADKDPAEQVTDQSKLSDELEKRAQEIEEKADQAVMAVEAESRDQLAAMSAEAQAAIPAESSDEADAEPSNGR